MKHLRVIWDALRFVWGVKSIIWGPDRLWIWRKAINLYLSFLAFTDENRPIQQLERAMGCAVVSAVYDYDSDHEFGERNGDNFKPVLEQLIDSKPARERALQLFETDTSHALSADGLERGSEALHFYRTVIGAKWMQTYSDAEIDQFGRHLQMVDDLLDFESDRLAEDTNCFLNAQYQRQYVAEVRRFIESDFFQLLQARSRVYRTIRCKAEIALRQFGGKASLGQLIATGRPHTGLYAFLLSLVSFGFFGWENLGVGLLTGVVFGLLTMSIMTFNDYIDRNHDIQKGKTFAHDHAGTVLKFWKSEAVLLIGLLSILAYVAPYVAVFCATVWLAGLLYSFIPHWFILQNILVAVCSGSPALCGMVNAGTWNTESVITFALFTGLILYNETNKDIVDCKIDGGYKKTIPVGWGPVGASAFLIAILPVVAVPFVLYPSVWVLAVGIVALPNIAMQQAYTFLHPKRVKRPIQAVALTIKMLGVALYLSCI